MGLGGKAAHTEAVQESIANASMASRLTIVLVDFGNAVDENSKTEVAREVQTYNDTIKTRQIVKNVNSTKDVIVRVLQQPTCTNASITESGIEVEVVLEEAVDVIGETKIAVTAFTNIDPDTLDDSFENEINENFINENAFR